MRNRLEGKSFPEANENLFKLSAAVINAHGMCATKPKCPALLMANQKVLQINESFHEGQSDADKIQDELESTCSRPNLNEAEISGRVKLIFCNLITHYRCSSVMNGLYDVVRTRVFLYGTLGCIWFWKDNLKDSVVIYNFAKFIFCCVFRITVWFGDWCPKFNSV